jgi:hypothetical protein
VNTLIYTQSTGNYELSKLPWPDLIQKNTQPGKPSAILVQAIETTQFLSKLTGMLHLVLEKSAFKSSREFCTFYSW